MDEAEMSEEQFESWLDEAWPALPKQEEKPREEEPLLLAMVSGEDYPVLPKTYRYFSGAHCVIPKSVSCSFTIIDHAGSMSFKPGEPVNIYRNDNDEEIFAGTVKFQYSVYSLYDCVTRHLLVCAELRREK